MMAAARLPQSALETIEDRHADLLIADAVAAGAVAIVARPARAYIDLNRDERELDPALLSTRSLPGDWSVTSKVTGGLGVVPSRIAAGGAVWSRPLDRAEVEARIATVHRPYHAAVAHALDEAMAVHGIAVLLDCHSMPPLGGRGAPARVVIGERHGRSADQRFVAAAMTLVWGRPLVDGGAVVTAELADLAVDQCVLVEGRFTLLGPDDYRGDTLDIRLYDRRGQQIAAESLYAEDDDADGA